MGWFSQEMLGWGSFYSTIANASATMLGLLFVALSVNRAQVMSQSRPELMHLAKRSCGDLIFLLMVALIVLIPDLKPMMLWTAWGVLALQRLIDVVANSGKLIAEWQGPGSGSLLRLRVYLLPALSALCLLAVSVGIFLGCGSVLYLLVPVTAMQLGSSFWNAWLLLTVDPKPAVGGAG
jgi:hypothetical protein